MKQTRKEQGQEEGKADEKGTRTLDRSKEARMQLRQYTGKADEKAKVNVKRKKKREAKKK